MLVPSYFYCSCKIGEYEYASTCIDRDFDVNSIKCSIVQNHAMRAECANYSVTEICAGEYVRARVCVYEFVCHVNVRPNIRLK